jgi:hypothetical protein
MATFAPAQVPAACRRGKHMVVPRGAALPPNCVKCGAPAQTPWRKKFYWHHQGYYFIALIALLLYIIVALIVRKSMELNVPLCDAHHSERKRYNLLAGILLLGAIPAGFVAGSFTSLGVDVGWLIGLIMFVAGLIFVIIAGNFFHPTQIDETHGVFAGAGEDFLRLLPPSPPGFGR